MLRVRMERKQKREAGGKKPGEDETQDWGWKAPENGRELGRGEERRGRGYRGVTGSSRAPRVASPVFQFFPAIQLTFAEKCLGQAFGKAWHVAGRRQMGPPTVPMPRRRRDRTLPKTNSLQQC